MEQNFNRRYIGRFLCICILLFIVMSFLPTPGIFNLLVAAGTAFYVGKVFAKDHLRVPTKSEQNQFGLKAFVALVGVVALLTTLSVMVLPPEEKAAFFAQFQGKPLSVMIVGTALAVLMMWGCIVGGFSIGARMHMKKLEKAATSA